MVKHKKHIEDQFVRFNFIIFIDHKLANSFPSLDLLLNIIKFNPLNKTRIEIKVSID